MKNVLIIGNGFDLDLGLKTSFHEFYNSPDWVCEHETEMFISKMTQAANQKKLYNTMDTDSLFNTLDANPVDNWNELERIIEEFAMKCEESDSDNIQENHYELRTLCEKAKNFIAERTKEAELKTQSAAAQLLKAISSNKEYKIFDFNYTDLNALAQAIGIEKPIQFESVHGNINEANVIMGAGNKANLKKYDIFKKMYARNYRSHNISQELQKAENVIFFGHSLCEPDNIYFRDFFVKQTQEDATSKQITFVTENDESRHRLIRRLEDLTNNKTAELFQYNNVRIFNTSDLDREAYEDMLELITETFHSKTIR